MIDTLIKLKQFQQESTAWKRMLAVLLQENAFLKMRLSDVVSHNGMNEDRLNVAEEYQSRLLRKEEMINLMRVDITELDRLLVRGFAEGELKPDIILKQSDLRREFRKIVAAFNELKFQFNDYVAEKF